MSRIDDKRALPPPGKNRVVIENVRPNVDGGRFAIKRVVGDIVQVEADVLTDGHDVLAAKLLCRKSGAGDWHCAPMTAQANDVWAGEFRVTDIGEYQYQVAAWVDSFGSWRRDLIKRIAAKQDISVDLLMGAEFVHQAMEAAEGTDRERLQEWEHRLRSDGARLSPEEIAASDELAALVARWSKPVAVTNSDSFAVTVDRPLASFSAWYEVFSALARTRRKAWDIEGRRGLPAIRRFDGLRGSIFAANPPDRPSAPQRSE